MMGLWWLWWDCETAPLPSLLGEPCDALALTQHYRKTPRQVDTNNNVIILEVTSNSPNLPSAWGRIGLRMFIETIAGTTIIQSRTQVMKRILMCTIIFLILHTINCTSTWPSNIRKEKCRPATTTPTPVSCSGYPPWILKRGGLESSGLIPSS